MQRAASNSTHAMLRALLVLPLLPTLHGSVELSILSEGVHALARKNETQPQTDTDGMDREMNMRELESELVRRGLEAVAQAASELTGGELNAEELMEQLAAGLLVDESAMAANAEDAEDGAARRAWLRADPRTGPRSARCSSLRPWSRSA